MNETENENKARLRYRNRGIYRTPDNAKNCSNDVSHRLTPSEAFYPGNCSRHCLWTGFLYDSKALLLLTIALTPFAAPFLGFPWNSTGSFNFLIKSFFKLLLAMLFFMLSAFGVGGFGRLMNRLSTETIEYFIHVYPMMLITVGSCAFLATIYLIRNTTQAPQAFSAVALSGVLLPLGLAGFSLRLGYFDPIFDAFKTSFIYGLIGVTASLLALIFSRIFAPKFLMFLLSGVVLLASLFYLLDYTKAINTSFSERLVPLRAQINGWIYPPRQRQPLCLPTR